MKRILCFLMACTMCASAAVGLSGCGCDDNTSSKSSKPGYKVEPTEPDLTNGDFGFFIINQEELMITKYTGSDTVIEIPESYKNYKVTVIGASVFNDSKITEVTIPSSIKQIEDYAFSSNAFVLPPVLIPLLAEVTIFSRQSLSNSAPSFVKPKTRTYSIGICV